MRVAAWMAIWVVLVTVSGWYLWRCARRLFQSAGRLADEVAQAERRLGRVQREVRGRHTEERSAQPAEADQAAQLAIFLGVTRAAKERRLVREALLQQRRARRDANRPGWARRVDSD